MALVTPPDPVTITKYYSYGKERSLEAAGKRKAELEAKHPDRQYMILVNMRSADPAFTVSQVQTITLTPPHIDIPDPQRSEFATYEDYYDAQRDHRKWKSEKWAPIKAAIRQKLNP